MTAYQQAERGMLLEELDVSEVATKKRVSGLDVLNGLAINHFGLPADFCFFRWAWMPPGAKEPFYMEMEGCVPDARFRSGPRKGRLNVSKCSGRQTVYLSVEKRDAWLMAWSQETGNCLGCYGNGDTITGCSSEGTTYRTCKTCGGTGKATP